MKLNGRLVVVAMSLVDETATAGVTKYSFIAYGDTRGRRDGIAIQYEHSLIVDSMLAQIKKLENTKYPVRFILQSGDAVAHGQDPKEWNSDKLRSRTTLMRYQR